MIRSRSLSRAHGALALVCVTAFGCAEAPWSDGDARDRHYAAPLHGGRFHARPVAATGARDLAPALEAAAGDIPELSAFTGDRLAQTRVWSRVTQGGATIHYLAARQEIDDVPVRGSRLQLAVRAAPGESPELVASSYLLYDAGAEVVPSVGMDRARALALTALRRSNVNVRDATLELEPRTDHLQLVWSVRFAGVPERAVVTANGDEAGRVRLVDERLYDAAGTVRGWVADGAAPRNGGPAVLQPLASLELHHGSDWAMTGPGGEFVMGGVQDGQVTAWLSGVAVTVVDAAGPELSASAPVGADLALELGSERSEPALAQVTAYAAATAVRHYLVMAGIPVEPLGDPVTANVNVADSCNAYYSPQERQLSFFRSGGGCNNTAESSIVAHEYGHFVNDMFGGIADGGLSEGWGDLISCFSRGDPTIGGDFFAAGGAPLRSCDNDYVYPAGGAGEVHELGQAWSGFGWDLRAQMIELYGEEDGAARAAALLLPSLVTNAPDILAAVREVVVRDDDDGDLTNQTPHWAQIQAAADRHGLGFVLEADQLPPAKVGELSGEARGAARVHLRWIAPGDDGRAGTAAAYRIRTAEASIDDASWPTAQPVSGPAPAVAGSVQEADVLVAPGAPVYVAIRAVDDAGNEGPLAQVGPIELPPAAAIFADGAEDGLGAWTAGGLWHVTAHAAATGAQSFWYGREESGTYATGSRTTGELVSPAIDLTGVSGALLTYREAIDLESGSDYDLVAVEARDADSGESFPLAGKTDFHTDGFRGRAIELAPLVGRRIRLAFRFDSIDASMNDRAGWMVDDVAVLADAPPAGAGRLIIDEVLADPPNGYDSNGDGISDPHQDEFVELVNIGSAPVDLSGATIADSLQVRGTLPDGLVVPAGGVVVIFGGGTPALPAPAMAVAAGPLQLNNDGDGVTVRAADGSLLASMAYPSSPRDQSLVRATEVDPGAPFVAHTTMLTQVASPGTRADGTPF